VRYFDHVKKELVEFDYERLKGNVKDDLAKTTIETLDGNGQQDRAVVRESLKVFANKRDPKEVIPFLVANASFCSKKALNCKEIYWRFITLKMGNGINFNAEIALPGNPSLLAGVVIELSEDEWMRYGGKWLIAKSEHDMKVSGGYTTKLTIKKYKD